MALVSWLLDRRNISTLSFELRESLLEFFRILIPWGLSLLITLLVPVKNRPVQLTLTTIAYFILVFFINQYASHLIANPIICVLGSICSVFALLPLDENKTSGFLTESFKAFLALLVPLIITGMIILVMLQINIFIKASFTSRFTETAFGAIYIPIYTVMQAFGFNNVLTDFSMQNLSNHRLVAFFNAILITNIFIVPTAIFVKAILTQNVYKIFLTFLGISAILTASIGFSISATLALILILFPGTFLVINFCSVCVYFMSLSLKLNFLIAGANLYRPDVNMRFTSLITNNIEVKILAFSAIILPLILIFVFTILRAENLNLRKQRRANTFHRTQTKIKNAPDLQVIAILRALAGISNIKQISRQGHLLSIHVFDTNKVDYSSLSSLCVKKVGFDRMRKIYTCDLGLTTNIIEKRLLGFTSDFMDDNSSMSENANAQPYVISPQTFNH